MRKTVFVCAAAFLGIAALAQADCRFEPMEYEGLPYQQLASNTNGTDKPALLVFLHGGHARGKDNQAQIQLPAARDIKDYIQKNNIPAYALVPQCPSGYEWIPNRGMPGCQEKVVGLVEKYAAEKGVDTNRIYIASVSMGSWASWRIVKENPRLFAAAFIASGAPKDVYPEDFKDTPIHVTVGSQERTIDELKAFADNIKKNGGTVKFDILEGCGHQRACSDAFTDKRLDWLFAQKRQDIANSATTTANDCAADAASRTVAARARDVSEIDGKLCVATGAFRRLRQKV